MFTFIKNACQMLRALGATLPESHAWRNGQDLGVLKWGQAPVLLKRDYKSVCASKPQGSSYDANKAGAGP